MQNDSGRFTVNIVPLQNIQSNITGISQFTALSQSVTNIQSMVNFTNKTIAADIIKSFTPANTIQFTSPISISTISVQSGSSPSLVQGSNGITVYNPSTVTQPAISFSVNNNPVLNIIQNGNIIYNDTSRSATEFVISSVTLQADNIVTSTLTGGTVYARSYVTLSDETIKSNIREWRAPILDTLSNIKPYTFTYMDDSAVKGNIGLLAQELAAVYPQCVTSNLSTLYVNYDSVVTLLLGAVRELSAKVAALERSKS